MVEVCKFLAHDFLWYLRCEEVHATIWAKTLARSILSSDDRRPYPGVDRRKSICST